VSLAALRVPSFRYQWPADLLISWAFEMETLVLGWYLLVGTGSVLWLTVFGALQFGGTLLAPGVGVLADRLGIRPVLCSLRGLSLVLAAALLGLAVADRLSPGWVLAVAAAAGLLRPNDLVLRNALIGATMPPAQLMGALGLSRATMDSARVAGALTGTALSAALGLGPAYVMVVLTYALGLALSFGVAAGRPALDPLEAAAAGRVPRPSGWRELRDGLAYVWTTPRVLAAVWLAFLVNLTAYPVTGGLLPYVARSIYGTDARGLGWLAAAFSCGALAGSLAIVLSRDRGRPERAMVVTVALWYVLLLLFAHARSMGAGIVLLGAAGIVQSVAMVSLAGSLLQAAGERFRARVMGVRQLAVYGLPVGLVACGALVDRVGFPATVSLGGLLGLALTAVIAVRWRAHVWAA
jgi:MFS family permease